MPNKRKVRIMLTDFGRNSLLIGSRHFRLGAVDNVGYQPPTRDRISPILTIYHGPETEERAEFILEALREQAGDILLAPGKREYISEMSNELTRGDKLKIRTRVTLEPAEYVVEIAPVFCR